VSPVGAAWPTQLISVICLVSPPELISLGNGAYIGGNNTTYFSRLLQCIVTEPLLTSGADDMKYYHGQQVFG
jgi:hypothetical protein